MNRPEIVRALANIFSLKGKLSFVLDETLVPVVNAGDLARTPYLQFPRPCSELVTATGGAATFAYMGYMPAPNKVLQIGQLIISNDTGAAITAVIRILTGANLTAVPITVTGQMLDLGSELAGRLLGSQTFTGFNAAGSLGNGFARINIPSASTVIWTPPAPGISLFGNDEGGVPGIAVVPAAVLQGLQVSTFAREWPLPGQ